MLESLALYYYWALEVPYKHTTWIPRWNDVETAVSTWNPRGVFVGWFHDKMRIFYSTVAALQMYS